MMLKNMTIGALILVLCFPAFAKIIQDQPIRGLDYVIKYDNQNNLAVDDLQLVYVFDFWGSTGHAFQGPKGLFKNVLTPDSGRATTVKMNQQGSHWEATIHIPDSVSLLSYYFTDGNQYDYNDQETYVSYIYGENGKPVKNARFRNVDFLIMAGGSESDVINEIKAETIDHPTNWIAHTVFWRKTFEDVWFFRLDAALLRANRSYDQLVQRFGVTDSLKHVKATYLMDYLKNKKFAGPETVESTLNEFTELMETISLENQYGSPKRQYEGFLQFKKMQNMYAELVGENVYADSLNFEFTTIEGQEGKLSDYQGNYLLLDFWGTWCGPCVAEIPKLKKAYATYNKDGFEILSICCDRLSEEELNKYVSEKEMTWTHVLEELGKGPRQKLFAIMSYPSLFLIDPEGKVVAFGGDIRGELLENKLKEIYNR